LIHPLRSAPAILPAPTTPIFMPRDMPHRSRYCQMIRSRLMGVRSGQFLVSPTCTQGPGPGL
jgi:hypothetical protein